MLGIYTETATLKSSPNVKACDFPEECIKKSRSDRASTCFFPDLYVVPSFLFQNLGTFVSFKKLCVCTRRYMHANTYVEVKGQHCGAVSLRPPCGSWDWTQVGRLGNRQQAAGSLSQRVISLPLSRFYTRQISWWSRPLRLIKNILTNQQFSQC